MKVILASASPRRRELLERAGLDFEVRPADIDETPLPCEGPEVYVERIAKAKADATAMAAGDFVIAADTTVTIDGLILAKAESPEEAAAMVGKLSGRTHRVITGFAVRSTRGITVGRVETEVEMIEFDPTAYVACGEWRGKAGAYAIQGVAARLVRAVRGSVSNVIGLPLVEVLQALGSAGGPVPPLSDGKGV